MKVIASYNAFRFRGDAASIGELVAWVKSRWDLQLNAKEVRVMGLYEVSFYYPNNDDRVEVKPGQIIYKGPYGAYHTIDPDLSKYPELTVEE